MKRPGDVVEDKQLPIKAAVALAVIKNAEKQRNALMFWHQGDVCGFFDVLCGRCNFDLLDDVQFAVRGSYDNQQHRLTKLAVFGDGCPLIGLHKLLKEFDGYPDTPIDGTPEAYEATRRSSKD